MEAPERGGERELRECAPRVLAALIRRFGDFNACEDALQEALVAALERWPLDGAPRNPAGWLYEAASRRRLNHIAAEEARRRRELRAVRPEPIEMDHAVRESGDLIEEGDDTLELTFACCHPSLSDESAIALTLRALG